MSPEGFEWDSNKNAANVKKHGIDFASATEVFSDPAMLTLESRHAGEEPRYLGIGKVGALTVTVVFTLRGDRVRIISARRSRFEERKRYEK